MMTKKEFDNAIRTALSEEERLKLGGCKKEGEKNPDYYQYNHFDKFREEMKEHYKDAYKVYKREAGEAGVKSAGLPNMASIASSSRFCYLALRDGAEALGGGKAEFEHPCANISGICGLVPQMDAFFKGLDGKDVYVEAKCHEIFDKHKVSLSPQYFNHIYGEGNSFGFPRREVAESVEIPLSAFGISKSSSMFDIKQFLCHLLGIAAAGKPARLVYLFFKPHTGEKDTDEKIQEVFDELTKEIYAIFGSFPIQTFVKKHNIELSAVAQASKQMEHLNSVLTIY